MKLFTPLRKTALFCVGLAWLVGAFVGCEVRFADDCKDGQCPKQYGPVGMMELPDAMKEPNYAGGSCVHASTVMVLRWQGQEELAEWWRGQYRGGEYSSGLVSKAESAGLRYAYTKNGDAEFLEWVSRTRRGAVIFYYPNHAVCFCGYENGNAVLLDNNRIGQRIEVPKETFIRNWRGYGGFGFSPVLSPSQPKPFI